MAVKINPDHLQNESTVRLDQDPSMVKISCKSMHKLLHEAAHRQTDRQTEWQTKRSDRITSALAEIRYIDMQQIFNRLYEPTSDTVNRLLTGNLSMYR